MQLSVKKVSMILPAYPAKIPKTSLPRKQINSFRNCWWRVQVTFQGTWPHTDEPALLGPSGEFRRCWTWWAGMNECQNKKDQSWGMIQTCSKRAYWIQGCQRVRPEPHTPSARSARLHSNHCSSAWSWERFGIGLQFHEISVQSSS